MTIPVDGQVPAAATTASTTSQWEDVVDIFYAPSSVFERRKLGRYGVALLVLALASAALYFAARPLMEAVMDIETARQTAKVMAENPQITEEQMAVGRGFSDKISAAMPFLLPIILVISIYIIGLGTWIVGKIVGAKQTFAAAVMVTTFSMFPRLLEGVLTAVQSIAMGTEGVTSRYSTSVGAARFLDPATTSDTVLKMASILNPFVLWGVFLLALGMRITGHLTWQKAAIVAVVVTLVRGVLGGF